MRLTFEDQLILSCVKIYPSKLELDYIDNIIPNICNWDYLVTNVIARGIAPLFYRNLPLLSNSSDVPQPITEKLRNVYYRTLSRSTILHEHFRKVGELFAENNIPVIALKGIYLSEWLYQDIGLRQFSDIDLLIKVADAEKCIALLEELGYNPAADERSEFVQNNYEFVHYTPMIKDGVSIELHIKLSRTSESYNLPVQELWNHALPTIINTVPVLVLDNNHLLIHLCGHLDKHFREGHVQFTCFL